MASMINDWIATCMVSGSIASPRKYGRGWFGSGTGRFHKGLNRDLCFLERLLDPADYFTVKHDMQETLLRCVLLAPCMFNHWLFTRGGVGVLVSK